MKKLALIALATALGLASASGFAQDASGNAGKPAMTKKMHHKKHHMKKHHHKKMMKKAASGAQ